MRTAILIIAAFASLTAGIAHAAPTILAQVIADPCAAAYKQLPPISDQKPTLVEDDCLQIPDGQTITIKNGLPFAIIAHKGFKFGRNAKISAAGQNGTEGPPPK